MILPTLKQHMKNFQTRVSLKGKGAVDILYLLHGAIEHSES